MSGISRRCWAGNRSIPWETGRWADGHYGRLTSIGIRIIDSLSLFISDLNHIIGVHGGKCLGCQGSVAIQYILHHVLPTTLLALHELHHYHLLPRARDRDCCIWSQLKRAASYVSVHGRTWDRSRKPAWGWAFPDSLLDRGRLLFPLVLCPDCGMDGTLFDWLDPECRQRGTGFRMQYSVRTLFKKTVRLPCGAVMSGNVFIMVAGVHGLSKLVQGWGKRARGHGPGDVN